MRLVAINTALFDKYKNNSEILTKSKLPYVLVIRLKYKAKKYDLQKIVEHCQCYLNSYAKGNPAFSTDIDYLISQLYPDSNSFTDS